jgi:MFS family permease
LFDALCRFINPGRLVDGHGNLCNDGEAANLGNKRGDLAKRRFLSRKIFACFAELVELVSVLYPRLAPQSAAQFNPPSATVLAARAAAESATSMSTTVTPPPSSPVATRTPPGLTTTLAVPLVSAPSIASRTQWPDSTSVLRRDLYASVWDAGAYSVMVGIAESYFGAFALALGLGSAGAGLMVTLPVLLGSMLQLCTPWGLRHVGSHKQWIVTAIFVQVACLLALPLAGLASVKSVATVMAFGAATLYWAMQFSCGGPWNTWMEELVPLRVRTRFFACRQRTSQICLLAGFVIGGLALQYGRAHEAELIVFAAIFFVAAACRSVSGGFMARQSESSSRKAIAEQMSLVQLVTKRGSIPGGRLIVYLLAMQVAVQVSGPYFTPFMLKQERWSYVTYMLMIGLCFLGKALSLPLWGRIGQRIGATRLMWIGGLAIVPISGMWLVSDALAGMHVTIGGLEIPVAVVWIAFNQLVSGMTWAAYELAMALLFLHGIPRRQRTAMLTVYHFGNSAAMVVGALIGLGVFQILGEGHNTYMTLFVMSSVLRLCMVPLLMRVREASHTPLPREEEIAAVVTSTTTSVLEPEPASAL